MSTIVAFVAAVVLLGVGGWQIGRMRATMLWDAEQNASSLARSLAQHAARSVDAVDLALLDAVEQVQADGKASGLPTFLARRNALLPQARNFFVVDRDGRRLASSAPLHRARSRDGRGAVLWHREHIDGGLHIDTSIVGQNSGIKGLPISRRFEAADGSFAGVAGAMLVPDYFERFYRDVQAGSRSALGLWVDDGRLLLRSPAVPQASAASEALPRPATAARFRESGGVLHGRCSWDGVDRLFAFAHVEGLPLVVSAALAVDDVLADWRREAALQSAVIGCGALVLVGLGCGLEWRRRRIRALDLATRQSDRQYRLLAENSYELIALKPSFDGQRTYVSPSSQTVVGWTPAELAALSTAALVHPDDLAMVRAHFAALDDEHPVRTVVARCRHKDGRFLWLETVLRRTGDGRILLSSRDVTQRREAEVALATSEARFRSLTDASSDVIQLLDLQGRRRYISPAAREVLGEEPDDLFGTLATHRVHVDDHGRVGALLDDLAAGRSERARSIHRVQHASGRWLWVDVHFRLVRAYAGGPPREVVASLRDVDDREAMRQEIEVAIGHLRSAEEIAQVGHWRYEVRNEALTWSEQAFRIRGCTPATFNLTLATAFATYHVDDRRMVREHVTAALERQTPYEFRARVVRPDGELRHVLARGLCETDAAGATVAIFGTIMDITDLHKAEIAALESETRYRLLAENSTDMITHMDLTGRHLFVSPASMTLTGHQPGELVGTHPADDTHADDVETLRRTFDDLAAGRVGPVNQTRRIRHKDGRWIWVEASIKLVRDASGLPTGFVGSVRNIMDRKLADEALRASEARYRIIAETTSDLVTLIDSSMLRQFVSPASRHVLGYEPEELLGTRPSATIHPDDVDEVRSLAARLMRDEIDGGRAVTTFRTRHKDGRWIWVEAGVNLVRDEATGQPSSLICSLRDVTERQRLARQMQEAKEVAEEATRVKSDFVANMSHELRTPLTGILGVHDLLKRDTTLDPAQRRLVELGSEAGTSLLAIVNDVLDFSKIEAGQLTLENVAFDLGELVAGCRDLAVREIRNKPIAIRIRWGSGTPAHLRGDPNRLRQILLNLLTNAVKFTAAGEIVIAASLDDGRLRLDVTDTGIGIPDERAVDLFERFTQGDTSMSRRYGGTGLGLAICKRLALLMGGSIGTLKAGVGAHFWVELPFVALNQVGPSNPQGPVVTCGRGAGRHLLLAEDNEINAEIIATMLRAQHYRVTCVAEGAAAAAAIREGLAPDLVLMDLQMPVMDGFEATATIRRHEADTRASRLPIIGLTANAFAEDAARCTAAGMNGHVPKPIVWPTLFATIDRCLEGSETAVLRKRAS